MDSLVVRCAFCTLRHVIALEGLETWFVECPCGARGFTENDAELDDAWRGRPGFTVKETAGPEEKPILLSDPVAVFVDERSCRWYVLWYVPLPG